MIDDIKHCKADAQDPKRDGHESRSEPRPRGRFSLDPASFWAGCLAGVFAAPYRLLLYLRRHGRGAAPDA